MASFFARLKQGLARSRDSLAQLVPGGSVDALSEEEWLDIEEGLIMADCGGVLSETLIQKARQRRGSSIDALQTSMLAMIPESKPINNPEHGPFVLLVVGVNGTGKTTTIGKLATMFGQQGKSVLVGAGDTFRAAAVDQLAVWVERAGADMVRQHDGADPASVAFDTIQRGIARNYDVVIIDTAGRVQTDRGLMDELAKVRRVIGKACPDAPHEVWHVVDAGTGQNAIEQVKQFHKIAGTTGLIVTKLDGTGKGGIVLQLSHNFGLPIRYIGVGESLEDLMPFNAEDFIKSLLPDHAS